MICDFCKQVIDKKDKVYIQVSPLIIRIDTEIQSDLKLSYGDYEESSKTLDFHRRCWKKILKLKDGQVMEVKKNGMG